MRAKHKVVFFSSCVGCDRSFVKVNLKTQEEVPFASQYPVCMQCMQKGTGDTEFWKEIKQKIHELTNNRNNTKTSSVSEPKEVSN